MTRLHFANGIAIVSMLALAFCALMVLEAVTNSPVHPDTIQDTAAANVALGTPYQSAGFIPESAYDAQVGLYNLDKNSVQLQLYAGGVGIVICLLFLVPSMWYGATRRRRLNQQRSYASEIEAFMMSEAQAISRAKELFSSGKLREAADLLQSANTPKTRAIASKLRERI